MPDVPRRFSISLNSTRFAPETSVARPCAISASMPSAAPSSDRVSSPSPPTTVSAPPPDEITSSPDVPAIVSSPAVPSMTLASSSAAPVAPPSSLVEPLETETSEICGAATSETLARSALLTPCRTRISPVAKVITVLPAPSSTASDIKSLALFTPRSVSASSSSSMEKSVIVVFAKPLSSTKVSRPAPPVTSSSPSPGSRMSLPSPPTSVLSCESPTRTSS